MARKPSSSAEPALNLDSLMDALTNVVAVLILVLILLQVDVGKTVERLLGNLPPASPEDIIQSKETLSRLIRERDAASNALNAPPPNPALLESARRDIALLEKSTKDTDIKLLEVEKLRQLQVKYEKERDAEQSKTDAIIAEIRRLEALLADTPLPVERKPDLVRIPNSREIPENSNMLYAYVVADRVHLVDPVTAVKTVLTEFDKVRPKMLKETIKVKNGKDRKIYDQQKIVQHFSTLHLNLRGQEISLAPNPTGTRMPIRISFDTKNGGVPLSAMQAPDSEWHRLCQLVRSYPRSVLMFRVRTDGFPAYLKAREIADAFNIPCGWEITPRNSHLEGINDFEVNRLETPKPQPKKPNQPPPPKRTLD